MPRFMDFQHVVGSGAGPAPVKAIAIPHPSFADPAAACPIRPPRPSLTQWETPSFTTRLVDNARSPNWLTLHLPG